MVITTEHSAFLRAICESPDDDLPRLVYADWLEEQQETRLAGFIRKQVAGIPVTFPLSLIPPCVESLIGVQPHQMLNRGNSMETDLSARGKINCAVFYRRGFIAEIRCTLAQFVGGGWADARRGIVHSLFNSHPITRVIITDANPNQIIPENEIWYSLTDGQREYLLMGFQRGLHEMSDDVDVRSAACVLYGRKIAGLPLATLQNDG